MAIESLAQQTYLFVDNLSVRSVADKTEAETAQEARVPDQGGDTVTISEEARALIALQMPDDSKELDQEKDMDQTIQSLKDRIEKLEEDIDELEDADIPESRRLTQIQDKESQLMEMRDQLIKAQQAKLKMDGQAEGGGTRANGFGNTAETF